jgi:hypothetical protein
VIAALLVGLATSPILAPAAWPAGWERELAAHFGDAPPVRPPDEAVDELIGEWVRARPTGLDVLLDPRWQGSDVFLLDAAALSRIDARIDLHALFPFAGSDASGRPFAMRAALLGRGRFAFLYDRPLALKMPDYAVLGRDDFALGKLDLGLLAADGLRSLSAFDEPCRPRTVDGPFGVAIGRVIRDGATMRVRTRVGHEVRVPSPRGTPRAPQIQAK